MLFKGQISEYERLAPLSDNRKGKAAFSQVYEARDIKTGKKVVLKTLLSRYFNDEIAEERFLDEASLGLDHPWVVKYIDSGDNPRPFTVSEFFEGQPLQHIRCPRFGNRNKYTIRVIQFYIKVCEALEYVHQQQVIHGDIKPSNILVSADDAAIKIIDFGQAYRLKGHNYPPLRFSMIYSPPEILLRRYSLFCPASDIYSTGISLYEILTGSFPFKNLNSMIAINLQLNHPLPVNKKIPAPLFDILLKATCKHPLPRPPQRMNDEELREALIHGISGRYGTAAEFGAALENCLSVLKS